MWMNLCKLLMYPAGENGAGGGNEGGDAGGGSLLTSSKSGGEADAGTRGAGTSQGATGDKPAGDAGAGDGSKGGQASDWRSSLPQELQENASLQKYTSVSALASAYIAAQKLIGADKISLPNPKTATEDDWKAFYSKLGVPESIDKYGVSFKDKVTFDEDFGNKYKEAALKAGMLPKQAQAMADWLSDRNLEVENQIVIEKKKAFETGVADLKKEWGEAFQKNVNLANQVVAEIGGDELAKKLVSSGYGADMNFMRLMAKIGDTLYKEHKITGADEKGSGTAMSPKELQDEIARLKVDPAYTNKDHPNHKKAVRDMQDLFERSFPSKS